MTSRALVALLVLAAAIAGCSSSEPEPPLTLPAPPHIGFHYVLYFEGDAPDMQAVAATAPIADGRMQLLESIATPPDSPGVSVVAIEDVARDHPMPGVEFLRFYARGLDEEEQARATQRSRALRLGFAHPRDVAYAALRNADELAHGLARAHGGLIWDEELRLLYSADAWEKARLSDPAAAPNVLAQTVVHSYQNDEYLRAVSLGMYKLGLPDLVVERTARANNTQLVHLLNAVAQYLVEGGTVGAGGAIALDAASIGTAAVRELLTHDSFDNATGKVRVRLQAVEPEEGDADNALYALRFDDYEGPDEFARQKQATSAFFGWSDSIRTVVHDDELEAVSAAARKRLPAIRDRFNEGALGDQVLVKAPFATSRGGVEWMWVEVSAWNGNDIQGLLANQPFDVPGLHAGEKVEVEMDDVFDYQWVKADGSVEGNTTGKVIEAMRGTTENRGAAPGE